MRLTPWNLISTLSQEETKDTDIASKSSRVLDRNEISDTYKWDLSRIFADQAAWDADAAKLENLVEAFTKFQGQLGTSAQTLLEAMQMSDEMGMLSGRLYVYAKMKLDEDTSNSQAQQLQDRAFSLLIRAESATAFFVPEILGISAARLEQMLDENKDLNLYRFALNEITRQKDHVLSPEQEALLAQFGEVLSAPSDIYQMYNNADMVFPVIQDENGNDIQITHGRYRELMENKNRDVRKAAFEGVLSTYVKHRNTIAAVYAANVKRGAVSARVRNYESARQASLDSDKIPVSVYDNLIQTVHEYIPSLNKYQQLRSKVLGIKELQMYDNSAPLLQEIDWKVPYDEARETVIKALHVLGEEYQTIARDGLENGGWVDVFENKGKRSGAYSWGTYGTSPYMLLNYNDSLDDMFTLAHELGHSMHRFFSARKQPYVYAQFTIFTAEVASTCNEALLLDHLLKTTEDKAARAYLINHQLESIRGTLFRQAHFAEFEMKTHAHVEAGGALTADWLDETYYEINQAFFGDVCHVNDETRHEWMRIPHFYTPFYVYKYATGISAALALSRRILNQEPGAVEDYLGFLSSGGSDYSIELLKKAGVDMASPEPVRAALQEFDRLVEELTKLIG